MRKSPKNHEICDEDSRYAYEGLDRVIHERARLGVMTCLATHPKGLTFSELKMFCALTDGNLNRHLQVLADSKLVVVGKIADQNRRLTRCRITALGRKRYVDYLAVLEQLLEDARAREQVASVLDAPKATSWGNEAKS